MTFLAVPRPLLRLDPVVLTRSDPHVDNEGSPDRDRVLIPSVTRGTWRELAPREQESAAQRGTISDSQCDFDRGADVQEGDWMLIHGLTYEVVELDDLRSYTRTLLRNVVQA